MQQHQRLILYILVLIGSAAWILLSATPAATSTIGDTSAPQVGFIAPDFSLKTPRGEIFSLSEQKGKAVLVNLWATWCPPCRAEMETIQKMYQEYSGSGFIVLAVDMTFEDDPFAILPFAEEHGLTFPILLDETGEVAQAYHLASLPSSYFIDRSGIIHKVVIGGPMSEALLRSIIEEILN